MLLTLAACSGIQVEESDVFLPKRSITPQTFSQPGVTLEEVSIPAGDPSITLNAWHLTQPAARGTVVFFGGQGFYLVQSQGYVEALTQYPVDVLMVDYRGYGKSEGAPSIAALEADALAVVDYATDSLGVAPADLVVHGHSLGTFVALYAATQRPTAGVVLENPATDVEGWRRSVLPWYLRLFIRLDFAESLQAVDNTARIQQVEEPVLIVAGSADPITPAAMARTLAEANEAAELVVVEGGGHNGLYEDAAVQEAYRALLDRALASAGRDSAARRP